MLPIRLKHPFVGVTMPSPAQIAFINAATIGDDIACLEALKDIQTFENVTIYQDSYICNPIHLIAKKGLTNVLNEMLLKGLNVSELDSSNQTAIHIALLNNHFTFAKVLAEAKPELCIKEDLEGANVLHLAAQCGQDDLVKHCVAKGMDVNAKSRMKQQTSLHFSAIGGHETTVDLLLELGARANVFNVGNFPPSIVCRVGRRELRAKLQAKEQAAKCPTLFETSALAIAQSSVPTHELPECVLSQQQTFVVGFKAEQVRVKENAAFAKVQHQAYVEAMKSADLDEAVVAMNGLNLGQ
jgi:ankyrin repeat protein